MHRQNAPKAQADAGTFQARQPKKGRPIPEAALLAQAFSPGYGSAGPP